MAYDGNDLNPLNRKPLYWALLGFMMLIGTILDFERTFVHGPQHRKHFEMVYDSCYRPIDNRTDLQKFWSALSRYRNNNKAVLVITSPKGARITLRTAWKAHVETLQNPALKGSKLKIFFSIDDKSYRNPVRIELNRQLIDDFEDDYFSPFAFLALTLLFFGFAARTQWRIWQESFTIKSKIG